MAEIANSVSADWLRIVPRSKEPRSAWIKMLESLPWRLRKRRLIAVELFNIIPIARVRFRNCFQELHEVAERELHRTRGYDPADGLASALNDKDFTAVKYAVHKIGKIPRSFGGREM
jgi:hypothetical protein